MEVFISLLCTFFAGFLLTDAKYILSFDSSKKYNLTQTGSNIRSSYIFISFSLSIVTSLITSLSAEKSVGKFLSFALENF